MSVNAISTTNLDFSRLMASKAGLSGENQTEGADFLSSLKLRMADFKSQSIDTLISSAMQSDIGQGASRLAALFGNPPSPSNAASAPLSTSGRNTSLFDPESAYRMMSVINTREVTYKAELSEMKDMKSYLQRMQQEGIKLGEIDETSTPEAIRSSLQAFADAYNGWIDRFDENLEDGGLLAGTHAATASQWELEKSVENFFNGAMDGVRGMGDLGLSIDPHTNMASLDTKRLDTLMSSNKKGVSNAIREFSANFAKSAELLNSDGNFIPNRLSNLDRVIDYIDRNKTSLQAEFGLGDPAKPNALVAKALAAYNTTYGSAA
ncbi:flagellar filament capping protein FliD [Azonexus sp.]|uniref:flagellar filament capping protein FliD n=1 Tax=Azonexus sp. TaxID=1872668 RepID=UPI0027BA5040|nr:flagellar filament capping protein FliD [Azonexus sp.]